MKTAMKPNQVKVSINAATGEYSMETGAKTSEALVESVTKALHERMTEAVTCGK